MSSWIIGDIKIEIGEYKVEEVYTNELPIKPSRLSITKDGILYCKTCKKRFDSEEMHDKIIAEETKAYYCHTHPLCTEKFTKHELVWHCKEHGIKIENYRGFYRQALKKHPNIIRRVSQDPKSESLGEPCEICFEFLENKLLLESHYTYHEDHYICEVCKAGFKKVMDYIRHDREHREDKNFACPLCEFTSDKAGLMRIHVEVHEQFRKYKCNTCQKRFGDRARYKEHIEYFHKEGNSLECDFCGITFKTPRYLNVHKLQHEWLLRSDKETQCSQCSFKFTSYRSMREHYKKHRLQTPHVCDVCGKDFYSKLGMLQHMRRHKGDKRYKCAYCDKTFVTNGGKKQHERVHTGEKPFECPHCEKKFNQRSSMVIHSRSHTGDRPYPCHLCERRFVCKGNLDAHLRSCKGKKFS